MCNELCSQHGTQTQSCCIQSVHSFVTLSSHLDVSKLLVAYFYCKCIQNGFVDLERSRQWSFGVSVPLNTKRWVIILTWRLSCKGGGSVKKWWVRLEEWGLLLVYYSSERNMTKEWEEYVTVLRGYVRVLRSVCYSTEGTMLQYWGDDRVLRSVCYSIEGIMLQYWGDMLEYWGYYVTVLWGYVRVLWSVCYSTEGIMLQYWGDVRVLRGC